MACRNFPNFPRNLAPDFTHYLSERPETTSHDEESKKAKTTELKQKETTAMKTKLTKIIMSSLAFACASVCLAATMALSTSATAQSAPGGQVCSAGMLRGLYLWTLDGYQNFGGNPVPKDLLEGIRFNGDGTLSVPFGTVNIGGTIVIDVSGGVGTYTVAADCTGTLSITDGPTFNMYVGPGAHQLSIINTGGGPGDGTGLGLGTATRLP